jgi:hypothetical protein
VDTHKEEFKTVESNIKLVPRAFLGQGKYGRPNTVVKRVTYLRSEGNVHVYEVESYFHSMGGD